jgi:HAMP domain-containing protein
MSIRLRLSLIYTGILAVVLITASLILYFSFFASTQFRTRQILSDNADRVLPALLSEREPDSRRLPRAPGLPNPPGPGPNPLEAYYYQLSTPTGQVLSRSENLTEALVLPLSISGLEMVTNGGEWLEQASLGDENLLIYSRLVQTRAGGSTIIQFAQSTSFRDQGLQVLAHTLAVGNLVIILIAFGIGWFMAGYSLRPIKRIQQTAQTIGAERDFNRRVDYTCPNDEVGQLASTFNDM